uniref:Retrovirus-related Pol polyprotein from transposon TNT 1-94 n=1 Tax=Tanacetum cinerariifolium TaxID=118510 RepID=A0A6L2MPC4_TANCI|nr:hypothetical protein [Tanacetum cinerariifolium]
MLNESYVLYDHVMNPLLAHQERKTRKDLGTRRGCQSTYSSSAFDQPFSSHLNDDDDGNGEGTSRTSTSSPICFVNSLTNDFLKKQTTLAISTAEAEYVSARKACQQALWMKQALIDYGVMLDDIPIMCDNKGAIDLSKNPFNTHKQNTIRHHFLRDNVQKWNISIEKVSSEENIADILTKPLKRESFNYVRLGLGMMKQID